MEQSSVEQGTRPFNRFMIPVIMGVVIAVVKMIFSAIQYKYFLESYKASVIIFSASFVVGAVLLLVTGLLQKRKIGKTITIKEAFQALFITVLIFVVANFIFDQVYMQMDPGMSERIYKGQVAFAKTAPGGAEKVKVLTEEYEKQKNVPVSAGNLIAGLLNQIIKYSILALIFALAISRKSTRTA